MKLSSNMISTFDDKINFPHELLSTNRLVANLRKAFAKIYQLLLSFQKLGYLR